VEALLGAYHIGYREIWNTLLVRAQAEDPEQAGRLLGLVNLLWSWLHAMTSAAADGYAETARAREQARISLEHQFLESLYGGQATAESTALAARAMDFDPHGTFQVICCPAEPWRTQDLDLLKRRLRSYAGTSISIVRGTILAIVFQGIPASQILGHLGNNSTPATAGVGLARPGLTGAAESIIDAERALALAEHRGGVSDFSTDWLASTMLPHMDRLQPLTDAGRAAEQPHLRDAIHAYSRHGFSITASAEALHIHPNTMKYRLDRWQQLTGWDPRTLDGLLRSLLSITFPPGRTLVRTYPQVSPANSGEHPAP
jgi:PucR-like helix-turn-helix protein/diguanylate cyclase with GGDEF domain